MDLHKSYFEKWNISPTTTVEQMPHTLLYISYTKRVIATQSHAQGLAVLLPCYVLYLQVVNRMLQLRDKLGTAVTRPSVYDDWIDMYAEGGEFEGKVRDYKAMVDAVCRSANTTEFEEMKRHFLVACKLEYMFWDQAMTMMQWPTMRE